LALQSRFYEGGLTMSDTNGNGRGERLQIMLADDELSALDDFRFKERMPSRAAAVRELLQRGLATEGLYKPDGRSKSSDFGVLASARSRNGKRGQPGA
jgi:hypothetical protein